MAHKFVRGITNVRDITKQSLTTNDLNDLLATTSGKHYIRRAGNYHCLTDNIKKIVTKTEGTLSNATTNVVTLPNYALKVNQVQAGNDANIQIDGTNINVEGATPFTIAEAIAELQNRKQIVSYVTSTTGTPALTDVITIRIKGNFTTIKAVLRDVVANADITIPAGNLGINYVTEIDCTQISISGVKALTSGKATVDVELRETTDRKTLFYANRLATA